MSVGGTLLDVGTNGWNMGDHFYGAIEAENGPQNIRIVSVGLNDAKYRHIIYTLLYKSIEYRHLKRH